MSLPPAFIELCQSIGTRDICNVIGTVIELLPAKQSSKGDWMITFTLDDSTCQYGQKCRLFARNRTDLPPIKGLGDVVVLQKLKYIANQGGVLSNVLGNPSPWAIFHSPIPKSKGSFNAIPPHVKSRSSIPITEQHVDYVMWITHNQDPTKFKALSDEITEKLMSNPSKDRICPVKDLVIDTFVNVTGQVVKTFSRYGNATLYITDYTENVQLYNYGANDQTESDDSGQRRWTGPPGKYTLLVECFPPHSDWINENIRIGDLVKLKNVHIKMNRGQRENLSFVEGVLHGARDGGPLRDKINVSKILPRDCAELMLRKEALGWAKGFEPHSDSESEDDSDANITGNKRKANGTLNPVSKSKKRKERNKKNLKAKAKDLSDSKERPMLPDVKQGMPNTAQANIETVPPKPLIDLNGNIRCEKADFPEASISEIRQVSDSHLSNDRPEVTHYATVRVADFKPANVENFARARDMTEEEIEAAMDAGSQGIDGNDSDESETTAYLRSTQVRRKIWEWKFALLLEDAHTDIDETSDKGSRNNQLIVTIEGQHAEYLLGMKALDLRTNQRTLKCLQENLFVLWGDLEEIKNKQAERKALSEISVNTSSTDSANSSQRSQASRKPFRCMIEEYGVQLGNGDWARKFRIKGTTIHGSNWPHLPAKKPTVVMDEWESLDLEPTRVAETPLAKEQNFRAPKA